MGGDRGVFGFEIDDEEDYIGHLGLENAEGCSVNRGIGSVKDLEIDGVDFEIGNGAGWENDHVMGVDDEHVVDLEHK